MKNNDIIKAWKNPEYRSSLTDAQRAELPSNPGGELLSDADLTLVSGGTQARASMKFFSFGCRCLSRSGVCTKK